MVENRPKIGDAVTVRWAKPDNTVYGGTEGVILGVAGDEASGRYLIIDRSTHKDSFKSALSTLGLFDFRVVPIDHIESIKKTKLRERPPGVSEQLKMKIEVDYKSNIDFERTSIKLRKRTDCKVSPMRNDRSEAEYGQSVTELTAIEGGASINVLATGVLQIFCLHKALDDCIKWVQDAVELWQGDKSLVLIPIKMLYSIHDNYKESKRPTKEVIRRLATYEEGNPIVFPLGWAFWLFSDTDMNPLHDIFPADQPLENFVFESDKKVKKSAISQHEPNETESKRILFMRFPWSNQKVTRYLGADVPLMQITGLIKTPEEEKGLMNMWIETRPYPWQWYNYTNFHGKVIVRDLTIDRKNGVYTVAFQKYSGNEF